MKVSPTDVKFRVLNPDGKVLAKGFDSRADAERSGQHNADTNIQGYVQTPASAIDARIREDRRKLDLPIGIGKY